MTLETLWQPPALAVAAIPLAAHFPAVLVLVFDDPAVLVLDVPALVARAPASAGFSGVASDAPAWTLHQRCPWLSHE